MGYSLECDIGRYGYDCYDTCGHCIDPAECNHVTGTCRTGCAAGCRGRLCIERISLLILIIEFFKKSNELYI